MFFLQREILGFLKTRKSRNLPVALAQAPRLRGGKKKKGGCFQWLEPGVASASASLSLRMDSVSVAVAVNNPLRSRSISGREQFFSLVYFYL